MVNLKKGQKVELSKGEEGNDRFLVGLGWDINAFDSGADFDLDTAAFLLTADGRVTCDADMVFYGNLKHASGAVEHLGDNRTGAGEGDDEQILIDVSKLPPAIEKIAFTITIYEADERGQNFGQVRNAFVHVANNISGEELVRYDLSEDFSIETAVVVGELYKHNGAWKFNAVGSGYQGGLQALCRAYGVNA